MGLHPFHPPPGSCPLPHAHCTPRSRWEVMGVILSVMSCSLNAEPGLPEHPTGIRSRTHSVLHPLPLHYLLAASCPLWRPFDRGHLFSSSHTPPPAPFATPIMPLTAVGGVSCLSPFLRSRGKHNQPGAVPACLTPSLC